MATAANVQHETGGYPAAAPAGWRERPAGWRESTERFHLRALPNEDVYFYSKKINNDRLVRPVNHAARKKEIGVMAAGFGMLMMVVLLTMPYLLHTMTNVELQKLRAENQQLIAEHEVLAARESTLMDPERLKTLAKKRNMVPPRPDQVIHVPPAQETKAVEAKLLP
jgi:cell division protein FtsL